MAYGIKGLVAKLKEKGLEVAEDAALATYEAVKEWALEEAAKGEHGLVDVAVTAAVPQIDPLIKKQIDKIDGAENI